MINFGVFTVIMCAYTRTDLLVESVEAIKRQTYPYWELILVDNAAMEDTKRALAKYYGSDPRIKRLAYTENQSTATDPVKYLHTCCNNALALSTGDYIWFQADDDVMADDYMEKMVALFAEHPECTTAAGLPVAMAGDGTISSPGVARKSNLRPRYMDGTELVDRYINGEGDLFNAPGPIFTVRRDALVKAGGIDRMIETAHLYGVVPYGITGFDETAYFYWRYHEGQWNRETVRDGWLGIKETRHLLRTRNIRKRYAAHIRHQLFTTVPFWFVQLVAKRKFGPALRILKESWTSSLFWRRIIPEAIALAKQAWTR